jgi:hypothetical protein
MFLSLNEQKHQEWAIHAFEWREGRDSSLFPYVWEPGARSCQANSPFPATSHTTLMAVRLFWTLYQHSENTCSSCKHPCNWSYDSYSRRPCFSYNCQTTCTDLEKQHCRQDKPQRTLNHAAILTQDGKGNTSSVTEQEAIGAVCNFWLVLMQGLLWLV